MGGCKGRAHPQPHHTPAGRRQASSRPTQAAPGPGPGLARPCTTIVFVGAAAAAAVLWRPAAAASAPPLPPAPSRRAPGSCPGAVFVALAHALAAGDSEGCAPPKIGGVAGSGTSSGGAAPAAGAAVGAIAAALGTGGVSCWRPSVLALLLPPSAPSCDEAAVAARSAAAPPPACVAGSSAAGAALAVRALAGGGMCGPSTSRASQPAGNGGPAPGQWEGAHRAAVVMAGWSLSLARHSTAAAVSRAVPALQRAGADQQVGTCCRCCRCRLDCAPDDDAVMVRAPHPQSQVNRSLTTEDCGTAGMINPGQHQRLTCVPGSGAGLGQLVPSQHQLLRTQLRGAGGKGGGAQGTE